MTDPAEEGMSILETIWMESIITNFAFSCFIVSRIDSRLYSFIAVRSFSFKFRREALWLIWSMDSSPETSRVFSFLAIWFAIWRVSVDFPMPGSPLSSISEPFTMPFPITRSNSLMFVRDFWLFESFWINGLGVFARTFLGVFDREVFEEEILMTSSTKLFHVSHCGHFPVHLDDSNSHF